jgi:hypothetical protein
VVCTPLCCVHLDRWWLLDDDFMVKLFGRRVAVKVP